MKGFIIGELSRNEMLNSQFAVGTILFLFGWLINNQSDAILISLKKKNKGYLIPYGGAFEYVSAANYFGELVEWFGWFVLTDSLAAFAFFIFTFSNLAPRAHAHHKWFKEKFGDKYPKSRKAIIPFIW
jgi:steroid 5-alpha-reductase